MWLKAFTWKNEGYPSDPFELVSDVDGPSAPIITNLTCHDEHSIYLEWERPDLVYNSLDTYYVLFRSSDKWEQFEEVSVPRNGTMEAMNRVSRQSAERIRKTNWTFLPLARVERLVGSSYTTRRSLEHVLGGRAGRRAERKGKSSGKCCFFVLYSSHISPGTIARPNQKTAAVNGKWRQLLIPLLFFFQLLLSNLTTNLWHELKVQGATRSIYNESVVYKGDVSDSQKILLRLNCDQILASTVVRTEDIGLELSAGMIAGGACVAFALILAVLAVGLWRKYFNESYYYLDESPSTPAPSIVPDWDIERPSSTTTSLGSSSGSSNSSGMTKSSIPAHLFIRHVAALHADGDINFSKEYEAIQSMSPQEDFPADSSYLEDNKLKNRYHNVVACKCFD